MQYKMTPRKKQKVELILAELPESARKKFEKSADEILNVLNLNFPDQPLTYKQINKCTDWLFEKGVTPDQLGVDETIALKATHFINDPSAKRIKFHGNDLLFIMIELDMKYEQEKVKS